MDLIVNKTIELPLYTFTSSTAPPTITTTIFDVPTSSLENFELNVSENEAGLTEVIHVWQNIVLVCIAALIVLFAIVSMFLVCHKVVP